MALPAGVLIKVVWGGPVTTSDDWSFGVWYLATAVPAQADLDTATADANASLDNTFWNPASVPWKFQVAAGCSHTSCRSYVYNNGALVAQSESTSAGTPGTGTNPTPPYTAACVTTRTAGFGRRRRGRLYLPATGSLVSQTTGLFTNLVQAHLDNLANVIGGVFNSGAPFQATPVVVSQTGGFTSPITSLALDNKPDTQRGRQNKDVASQHLASPVVV